MDIAVPPGITVANQLVFLFIVESDAGDQSNSVILEITLPGESAKRFAPATGFPPAVMPGTAKKIIQYPFIITRPMLRPGQIVAKAFFDEEEVSATAPRIIAVT
jgi:hypothetical protein